MNEHPKPRPPHTGCPTCTRNGVSVLDTLLDLGWRPGGER